MKPPKIQEHHLSGAIQLLQVLSSHPLGSGNGGFNPKIVTIFTGKMMMNPGNTCCFRIIFRYRTRHFHFAAPSQLTHPVGSLERPARSTRAVSAAALNYLPLVRADHSTAKVLQLEVGFGRPLTIY